MTLMSPLALLPYYFYWHYGKALAQGTAIINNFCWFIWHFFSVGELWHTLFQPFQRLHEERQGNELFDYVNVWLINILMIMAGAIIRGAVICFACVLIVSVFAAGMIGLLFWMVLPLCIPLFFITGIVFFVKS
jgi:hypothetical protein